MPPAPGAPPASQGAKPSSSRGVHLPGDSGRAGCWEGLFGGALLGKGALMESHIFWSQHLPPGRGVWLFLCPPGFLSICLPIPLCLPALYVLK